MLASAPAVPGTRARRVPGDSLARRRLVAVGARRLPLDELPIARRALERREARGRRSHRAPAPDADAPCSGNAGGASEQAGDDERSEPPTPPFAVHAHQCRALGTPHGTTFRP